MTTTEPTTTTNGELAAWLQALDMSGLSIESRALLAELEEAMRPVLVLVERMKDHAARVDVVQKQAHADVAALDVEDATRAWEDGISAVIYAVTGYQAMWDALNRHTDAIHPEEVLG